MDKPIRFQLDHVSGNKKDNSRENLRVLCPNCHTQTPTWGYRGKWKDPAKIKRNLRAGEKLKASFDTKWEPFKKIILEAGIDFTKYGWRQKVATLLGITPHSVARWMKRYLPNEMITSYTNGSIHC